MRSIIFVLCLSLIAVSRATAVADGPSSPTVLLIGKQPDHPYGSHMYLHTNRMLAECLKLNGQTCALSDGWPQDAALLENVKTIVLYSSPGAEFLLDSPDRDKVDQAMQRGVGLVTIHWASAVIQKDFDRLGEQWMSYLGGTWISNVGLSTDKSELKQLDPAHPICRGWSNYDLFDEYYLNPTISKQATPLLQVTTKGQEVIVGWAFERPKGGRAYGTTLGHFYSNFENEAFRRTIVNAILWTAGVDVPKSGARVDVGAEALTLPPDPAQTSADSAFPPHRVIGNTYYVGSKALATYLITTPEGHFLINSGFEETVPLIRASVEALGFQMRDVKAILASHAHADHVAGHAKLKELTGAKVYVMRGDDNVIAAGGEGQYLYTDSRWPICPVDVVLEDRQTVTLGGVTLTARLTPGHTRGCTSWTWQVADGGKTHDVVVIGSPNVNPGYRLVNNRDYPEIASDYGKTFAVLKSLPCDIFLGAHGEYYGMPSKHERLLRAKPGDANAFIDPRGYRAYVEFKERAFQTALAEQRREVAGDDDSKPPEGFKSIFNGKDLTDWEGHPVDWKVADGCLTGTADGKLKYNRFIVWRGGKVKNFELRIQVKVSPGGNSGLQYRGTERPDLGENVVTGYQCDVVAGRADYDGMLYEERGRRILAHTGERVIIDTAGQPWVAGTFKLKAFKPGEWHDYRVLVEGNHHRHWIDGHPTTDVIDLDEKGRALEGILGMQVHVGPPMTIQYRNIFLKPLPDDLPLVTPEKAPIPADAPKVVPQGQDKPKQPDAE